MKNIVISAVLASVLSAGFISANTELPAKTAKSISLVKKSAVKNAKNDAKEQQKKLVQEALDSLKYAHQALVDLNKKDTKAATGDIEKALGKLEVILSAENAPKLLPVDATVSVSEYIGDSDKVKKSVEKVKDLLDDGKVQEARILLSTLQSEMDITIVNLPLGSYPDALKLAAKYIHNNKLEKAKDILSVALSTFDQVTQVVPLPLVKAVDLAAAASDVAKKDKEKAFAYLDEANDQLAVADALGYMSKSDTTYKKLHQMIKEIKKEVKGKNKAEKLFDDLITKLKDFKDKTFSSSKDENKK